MGIFVVFGLLWLVWVVWQWLGLPGSFRWNAERRSRAEQARLQGLALHELVAEVRKLIQYEKWQGFPAAGELLTHAEWSELRLLASLNALYDDAAAEDRRTQRVRGEVFEFYDCGLMSILEILQSRTACRER